MSYTNQRTLCEVLVKIEETIFHFPFVIGTLIAPVVFVAYRITTRKIHRWDFNDKWKMENEKWKMELPPDTPSSKLELNLSPSNVNMHRIQLFADDAQLLTRGLGSLLEI